MFSRSTLDVFAQILGQITVNATDPDLIAKAATLAKARDELQEAMKELPIVLPMAESPLPAA